MSNPPLELVIIRDERGQEFAWREYDPHRKILIYEREERFMVITVQKISIADAGEYTLYANNGKMETELKLTLRVNGDLMESLCD